MKHTHNNREYELFYKQYGVWVTENHEGKMWGIHSVSTSCKENPICAERAKDPASICSECFAMASLSYKKGLADHTAENLHILTTEIIPVEAWPLVSVPYFRLESFGDLMNSTQVQNYFNFAHRNPHARFALWTKNPGFIKLAIAHGAVKPSNLSIVLSSPYLNREYTGGYVREHFPFVDHVFTVYTKDFAIEHDTEINCGSAGREGKRN